MPRLKIEIALSIRDLVDVYQEYQAKFKDFSDSNLAMRNCLYSIPMNMVTELDEWHDRNSNSAFSTTPGCEAILEPSLDPPEYEQILTVILEQIRYQSVNQGQQGDPRRHSTPQNSRESVFNSDVTMIAGTAGGMTALSNMSQLPPQTGYQQPAQGVSSQAGSSQTQQPNNIMIPGTSQTQQHGHVMLPGTFSTTHTSGTSLAQQPLLNPSQLAVPQPGAVQVQQHSTPGLVTQPIHHLPTNPAPVVGSLGPVGQPSTGIFLINQ